MNLMHIVYSRVFTKANSQMLLQTMNARVDACLMEPCTDEKRRHHSVTCSQVIFPFRTGLFSLSWTAIIDSWSARGHCWMKMIHTVSSKWAPVVYMASFVVQKPHSAIYMVSKNIQLSDYILEICGWLACKLHCSINVTCHKAVHCLILFLQARRFIGQFPPAWSASNEYGKTKCSSLGLQYTKRNSSEYMRYHSTMRLMSVIHFLISIFPDLIYKNSISIAVERFQSRPRASDFSRP